MPTTPMPPLVMGAGAGITNWKRAYTTITIAMSIYQLLLVFFLTVFSIRYLPEGFLYCFLKPVDHSASFSSTLALSQPYLPRMS